MSLTDGEKGTVRRVVGGNVKAIAVARLYTTNNGGWCYEGKWGGLALVAERDSHFLRLVDLDRGTPIWEHELYDNIVYSSPAPFFHTFEGHKAVVGLSFADEQDARVLYNAVVDVRLRMPAPSPVPHNNNNAYLHPGAPAQLAHSTSGVPPPRLQTPPMGGGGMSASTSSLSAPGLSRPPLSPRNRTLAFPHLRSPQRNKLSRHLTLCLCATLQPERLR
jgi:hypothetical protein